MPLLTLNRLQRAMGFMNTMVVEDQSAPVPGTEGVTNDRVGMNMWGPWASWYIMADVEFAWDVAPIRWAQKKLCLPGAVLSPLSRVSEHQDEVRQFMEFFLSPDTQYQRAADWAWFPSGNGRYRNGRLYGSRCAGAHSGPKAIRDRFGCQWPRPLRASRRSRLQNIYDQELSLVFAGEKTMDDALAAIHEGWQDILEG